MKMWSLKHYIDTLTTSEHIYTCTCTHTHTTDSMLWFKGKTMAITIILASIILLMLFYTIIKMLLQSITGLIVAIKGMITVNLLTWSAHSSNHERRQLSDFTTEHLSMGHVSRNSAAENVRKGSKVSHEMENGKKTNEGLSVTRSEQAAV